MALPKLNLSVPQEGYSVAPGDAVLSAKLSSGPSRTRLDMFDAPDTAEVGLVLTQIEYAYWQAFFRSKIAKGALPFTLSMIYDSSEVADYEVKIIPGSISTSVQGKAHLVRFQAEVASVAADPIYDEAVIMLVEGVGETAGYVLSLMERLVNIDYPAVFHA